MDLSFVADSKLTADLEALAKNEREITVQVLRYLIEVDRRRLYAEMGYSSLFDLCVRHLKYSESGAGRRVAAARCLRDFPEFAEKLASGEVNLSTLCVAAESIRKEKIAPEEISGRSTREVQALIAPLTPVARKPRESVRPVAVKKAETPLLPQEPVEERYEIRFSVTKEMFEKLEEAKNRLSHSLGKEMSNEALVGKLLERFLKEPQARKAGPSEDVRHIPSAVKRQVFARDGGRCTYRAADGTRCACRRFLQYDHIVPVMFGGESTAENVRLLCSAHNQAEARRVIGPVSMARCTQRWERTGVRSGSR